MAILQINIQAQELVDYDDNIENVKYITGSIDSVNTKCSVTVNPTVTDDDAKQAFRNHITEKGFTWDNEI